MLDRDITLKDSKDIGETRYFATLKLMQLGRTRLLSNFSAIKNNITLRA